MVERTGVRRGWLAAAGMLAIVLGVAAWSGTNSVAEEQVAVEKAPVRTFRGKGGQSVRGKVISIGETQVVIESVASQKLTLPIADLSDLDQKYVERLRPEQPAGTPAPTTPSPTRSPPAPARPARTGEAQATSAGDWYQWRGPARDGVCTETGLNDDWSDAGPPIAWRTRGLGRGFSSVAISQGRIYSMGKFGGDTFLVCRSLGDGEELWKTRVGGGDDPNCTPTIDPESQLVYAVSHGGDLLCANAESGDEVWRKNFGQDFGGQMMSGWGYSESPLVDGDRLICTPGSNQALLAALDKRTGEVIWKTPVTGGLGNAGKDGAGYSSIVISNGGGVKQYIQLVGRGIVSVAADDGRGLWNYNRVANGTANIPTPIVTENFVFTSTGYGDGGTALLELSRQGRGVTYREVYYHAANELQNHHGGMVLVGDHVYMGHGHNNGFPACIDLRTGRNVWGRTRGAGEGSAAIVYADGDIYYRYENAVLALVEANPQGYNLKHSFQLATNNGKSWAHPVIQDRKLYLRDQDELVCYDLGSP